jgi:ECF transporter S component (folate family)
MKSFFNLFVLSAREITGQKMSSNILNIVVTSMLIALSMSIEALTIPMPFGKINFAFLAIAAIGMLYGPTVSFFAGGMCDILGYLVHPDGGFLPVYVLIGMLQGLFYGLVLYRRWGNMYSAEKSSRFLGLNFSEMALRLIIARLLDVVIINLLLNTAANLYYGFIPAQAFGTAVAVRLTKNIIELFADIPLLLIIMPVVLGVYSKTAGRYREKSSS